jgi:hypothetical protein
MNVEAIEGHPLPEHTHPPERPSGAISGILWYGH